MLSLYLECYTCHCLVQEVSSISGGGSGGPEVGRVGGNLKYNNPLETDVNWAFGNVNKVYSVFPKMSFISDTSVLTHIWKRDTCSHFQRLSYAVAHKRRCRCSSLHWWVGVSKERAALWQLSPQRPLTWNSPSHSPFVLSLPPSLLSPSNVWLHPPPSWMRHTGVGVSFQAVRCQLLRYANKNTIICQNKLTQPFSPLWGSGKRSFVVFGGFRLERGSSCSYASARIASPHTDRKFNCYPRAQPPNMISMDSDDNGFYMQLRQRGNYPVYGNNGAGEWDNWLLMSVVVGWHTGNMFIIRFYIETGCVCSKSSDGYSWKNTSFFLFN